MNIAGSRHLKEISDLSNATNLEILNLCYCTSLVTLHSSIRNLKNLRELSMVGCSNLEALPTDVNLESLNYLDLRECSRLRSVPQISRNISKLVLDGTAMEEEDCLWIENLSGLTLLDWANCPLKCMPSNFNSEHLTELIMRKSKLELVFHERTKHIELDCHFIRDEVLTRNITLYHVVSKSQLADIFTKPIGRDGFEYFRSKLGIRNLYALA